MKQADETYVAATWQKRVENWLLSGLSMAKLCREHEVSYNQFVYYKTKVAGHSPVSKEVKLKQFLELVDTSVDPGIIIECRGFSIRLERDFDKTTLLRCLQVASRVKL